MRSADLISKVSSISDITAANHVSCYPNPAVTFNAGQIAGVQGLP